MQNSIALPVVGTVSGLENNQKANQALETIATCFSGPIEPDPTYAHQWWADTANDRLKQRNAANDAWISVLVLSTGAPVGLPASASQVEMEAGTEAGLRLMSPLRIAQAIAALGSAGTDQVARDQIALTNLRLMLNSAITTGALVQGKQWELATDEWGSSSANETYTAPGSVGYYSSSLVYGSDLIDGTQTYSASSTASGSAANVADEDNATTWDAGSAADSWWKVDFGVGNAKTVNRVFYKQSSGESYSTGLYVEGSNDNSAWTQLYSASIPAINETEYTWNFSNSTAYRYYRIRCTYSPNNSLALRTVRMYEGVVQNITLIPPAAISVSTAPTYMDCYFLWKDDSGSAVIGTDLTVELSRDNGTTYTTATLTNLASYDGTYSIIKARANVSSQPSGTSMLCRIKTLNNKAQRIAAPALYAE